MSFKIVISACDLYDFKFVECKCPNACRITDHGNERKWYTASPKI